MGIVYKVPLRVLNETFACFRACGRGRRECQVLWLSSWAAPEAITMAVHPEHEAHSRGFVLNSSWLNNLWMFLARENLGIRLQAHTHPSEAFHSSTDDEFPIIHSVGFLSLVIPNFALGPIGFADAYLTEIQGDGRWRAAPISERLVLT